VPAKSSGSSTITSSFPLGANVATWDSLLLRSDIPSLLQGDDVGLTRFPGGSTADDYDWQTNAVSGEAQPVDFAQYSNVATAAGAQKFVTVNFGSGTPSEAAAWVTQSSSSSNENVALWEIGNEEYGSWETDNNAAPHTPTEYATIGKTYMQAMKAADPSAQIGFDYGMDGSLAPGSGADNWQTWDDTVLGADASYINFADVHWYPFNGTPTETPDQILATLGNIPTAASEIGTALGTYDPSAYFVVGETNMSNDETAWNEEPVGALFSAGNALQWLAYGAHSVDWWDVHNDGSSSGDFGLLSSGYSGEPATDTPFPPYYGYQLASVLAQKGATVSTLGLSAPNTYGWSSALPGGGTAVMLINADPTSSPAVPTSSLGISGSSVKELTYDNADPSIVQSTADLSGGSVTLPAESIVVLSTSASSSLPTTTTTPPPAGGWCSATYAIGSSWSGGFTANVTVTANPTYPISNWTVTWTWANGQVITSSWNADLTQAGSSVTASSQASNGSLAPGTSTSFGFQGTDGSTNTAPALTCTTSQST
jgi:hypothetical protein